MNAPARLAVPLLMLTLLMSLSPQADAIIIPAGDDLFETVPGFPAAGGTWADTPIFLPAGFFWA